MAAFRDSMEKDSTAQRSEVATLVQRAAERGKDFIDDTLQLSNVQVSLEAITRGRAVTACLSIQHDLQCATMPAWTCKQDDTGQEMLRLAFRCN